MEIVALLVGVLIGGIVVYISRPRTQSLGVLVVEQLDDENCTFQFMFNEFKDIIGKRQITLDVKYLSHK